jgi:hypothetical protein
VEIDKKKIYTWDITFGEHKLLLLLGAIAAVLALLYVFFILQRSRNTLTSLGYIHKDRKETQLSIERYIGLIVSEHLQGISRPPARRRYSLGDNEDGQENSQPTEKRR